MPGSVILQPILYTLLFTLAPPITHTFTYATPHTYNPTQAGDLELDYGDDLEFLMARLRKAEGDKEGGSSYSSSCM